MTGRPIIVTPEQIPEAPVEEQLAELAGVADAAPAGDLDWLDEMAGQYEEIQQSVIRYKTYWPFWDENLAVTFRLPDTKLAERLKVAVQGSDKSHQNRQLLCSLLAELAVSLEYKGHVLDDHVAFGPNTARALKAKPGASQADLVWLATREDLVVLSKFATRVNDWTAKPKPLDETDPFDGPFAAG